MCIFLHLARRARVASLLVVVGACLVAASTSALADKGAGTKSSEQTKLVPPEPLPLYPKRWARMALLQATALGGGTAWYWLDRERQVADWDFPSWRDRLGADVIRYDNNPFHVNFAWHAGNGASFHLIARTHGLSLAESLGAGLLTSLVWEYALEYREKVSANDLLFTTGAGFPLGEWLFSLGRHVHKPGVGALKRWTLGFPQALTRAMDGAKYSYKGGGIPVLADVAVESKVQLSSWESAQGTRKNQDSYWMPTIGLSGKFIRLPGFKLPGSRTQFFRDANVSRGSAQFGATEGGSTFRVSAESILLGVHSQKIDSAGAGTAHLLGVALAYRYEREEVGEWDERFGVLHMPGLAYDHFAVAGDFSMEVQARVHPDFAGINSLPNGDWNRQYPDTQGKSILRKMGYAYGFGGTTSLRMAFRYRQWSLRGLLRASAYRSDQGLDRIQEDLDEDQSGRESLLDADIGLQYQSDTLPLRIHLGMARRQRGSNLEEFQARARMLRYQASLGWSL